MTRSVLITGCSTGFGNAIARHFIDRGWKVIATMRTPREDVLPSSHLLRILPLDVTDPESIRRAVEAAGPIDVLVNNAGIGTAAPFEAGPMGTVREVFETNTFGTMAMTQALLPQFRERRSGVIVNVTSSITYKPLPLVAAYRASKAAVNAFSESLAEELLPFGVLVRVVLPGRAPETPFAANGRDRMQGLEHEAYADLARNLFSMLTADGPVTYSQDVAEAVWLAATDPACPFRLPAGADAVEWAKSV
jgi:NAD(P)-dependent dehydrogenase (short-subunit alcohol dehydrogenase family)